MHRHAERQYLAAAGVGARVRGLGACAMATAGSWSITPFTGVNTTDPKPERPRPLVTSP